MVCAVRWKRLSAAACATAAAWIAVESILSAQTPPTQNPPAQTPPTQTPPKSDAPQTPPPEAPPQVNVTIDVVETAPLPGVNLHLDEIPAPAQTATGQDFERSGALNVSDFLNRRITGINVNELQGNPYQSDISYRGYTASPLLGTPQGLSVYMDGVRLNQPFGDVVSWDLIPQQAIASTTLMPGSNPLFGLNTLGGALALQTKDGFTARGTDAEVTYGSDARRSLEVEHGGHLAGGFHWYVAGNFFGDDGWRDASSSTVRQGFGKLGWLRAKHDVSVAVGYADNSLSGNGLQEQTFLARDYSSVYTKPDITKNRSASVSLATRHALSASTSLSANVYYRGIRTSTANGDLNENSLDQAVYQPTPAEQAALTAAGYTGFPTSGASAANTPFPFWRCIANVLLNDAPGELCTGLVNRTATDQHNEGATAQLTRQRTSGATRNLFTVGGGYDHSHVDFSQSRQLGYLNPDRSITGLDAFADGVTGGAIDGVPFDNRVDLDGSIHTWSIYATDTLSHGDRWHLTMSGRYNDTAVHNRDRIRPDGGSDSLNGDESYRRFNPAIGVTFNPARQLNVYAGYSEGSRAPTSVELGCANPENPCKLPNALTGDPPLAQVVARTWEAGVRGSEGRLTWNAGVFRSINRDDILFVTSEQTGFGYFRNFGETERQGIEAGANAQVGRLTIGAGYTYLKATYQNEETIDGGSNSNNDAARDGQPGLGGTITIQPGDRIPLIPAHTLKAYLDVQAISGLSIDVDLVAASAAFARGNEDNQHVADGVFYLGPGSTSPYAIVNVAVTWRLRTWLQIIGQVNNVLNTRYDTAAQLGPFGFTDQGNFIARPFPPTAGGFPVRQSTFYAPGAPARAWIGTRFRF
jgi:outer membrane receptor protein involved in Fe transport